MLATSPFERAAEQRSAIDHSLDEQSLNVIKTVQASSIPSAVETSDRAIEDISLHIKTVEATIESLEGSEASDYERAMQFLPAQIDHINQWVEQQRPVLIRLGGEIRTVEMRIWDLQGDIADEMPKAKPGLMSTMSRRRLADLQKRFALVEKRRADLKEQQRALDSQVHYAHDDARNFRQRYDALRIKPVEQLMQSVVSQFAELQASLDDPKSFQAMNEELIMATAPAYKLVLEADLTEEEALECIEMFKTNMRIAAQERMSYDFTPEEREESERASKRLAQLDEKSGGRLSTIMRSINEAPARKNYKPLIALLCKEMTKRKLEAICAELEASAIPQDVKDALPGIVKNTVVPPRTRWMPDGTTRSRNDDEDIQDIKALGISYYKDLDGLERWKILKQVPGVAQLFPPEVIDYVERTITQRLCDEVLIPGGRESWDGTYAMSKISEIGNPSIIPSLLRHIELSRAGHTSRVVAHGIKQLLVKSDPKEVEAALSGLRPEKRLLLQYFLNYKGSIRSSFPRMQIEGDDYLSGGDKIVSKEILLPLLKQGLDEQSLSALYFASNDEDPARTYYSDKGLTEIPGVPSLAIAHRDETERAIIASKLSIWVRHADKVLSRLVNPKYGEPAAFPRRILTEGLGITDADSVNKLEAVYSSKTVSKSGFEREGILDGLILLNAQPAGQQDMRTLFERYRGARKDPERLRKVFQLLQILDGFGEYELVTPDPVEIAKIENELAETKQTIRNFTKEQSELQSQLVLIPDTLPDEIAQRTARLNEIEAAKKELIRKERTLTEALEGVSGLKGVEDALLKRAERLICEQLHLSEEYRSKIGEHIDELVRSGLLEIVPTLAARYEPDERRLLSLITMHAIDGDFTTWKYAHEKSDVQLKGLSSEEQTKWKENGSPIELKPERTADEVSRSRDEVRAAQKIVADAKAHIQEARTDIVFSPENLSAIRDRIRVLIAELKRTEKTERGSLEQQKRRIEAEANLIEGILAIETADPETTDPRVVLTVANQLKEHLDRLELSGAALDIAQIGKIFTVKDVSSVLAYEADDAPTLLNVGIEPRETCQSWRNGTHNECLLAYVADANKKVINVCDEGENVLMRSVIKLTHHREPGDLKDESKQRTIFFEKPYSINENDLLYRAFIRKLLLKASALNCTVTATSEQVGEGSQFKVFTEEAERAGYRLVQRKKLDMYVPQSLNRYEYSDGLGGKLNYFDIYKEGDFMVFEKMT